MFISLVSLLSWVSDGLWLMFLRMTTILIAFMLKLGVGRQRIWWMRVMSESTIPWRRSIRLVVWRSFEISFLSFSCQGKKGIETGPQRREEKYRIEQRSSDHSYQPITEGIDFFKLA